jgi:hypothetical protein
MAFKESFVIFKELEMECAYGNNCYKKWTTLFLAMEL